MAGRVQNLKPWPKGVSGNSAGRPKNKLLSIELEKLLEQKVPTVKGKSWAVVIAEALLKKACKGDVRAFTEIANRIEGKPLQQMEVGMNSDPLMASLAERLNAARERHERENKQSI